MLHMSICYKFWHCPLQVISAVFCCLMDRCISLNIRSCVHDSVGQIYSVIFKRSPMMSCHFLCVAVFLAASQILRSCPAQSTLLELNMYWKCRACLLPSLRSLWSCMGLSYQNKEADLCSAVVGNAAVPRLPWPLSRKMCQNFCLNINILGLVNHHLLWNN